MNTKNKLSLATLALCTLAACGSDTYVMQGTTISKGQELSDLQRALNEGAINQQEYDRLYKRLLARPN